MAGRPGAADAIQGNMEPPGPNRGDIDHWQRQHGIEVAGDRLAVLPHLAEAVPPHARRALLGECPHPRPGLRVEEDAVRARRT